MSRKAFAATALAVCLAIVFAAISAADRSRSRDGRGTRGAVTRGVAIQNIADTFDPRLVQNMSTVELEYVGNQALPQGIDASIGESIEDKASNLIQFARTQGPVEAQATLRSVLGLGLQDAGTERARRILAMTYEDLASFYEGEPDRQAYLIAQSAAVTSDPDMRRDREDRAYALGAGRDVVEIAATETTSSITSPTDFGSDDSCSGAPSVGAPSITTMSIANPVGGFQDKNFLQIVVPTGLGLALEIETTSTGCSDEASCSNVAYDTDLSLWQQCEGGFEDMLLERDPTGDSGMGWLSKIETACLLPDTYFLEVTGQFGAAPKNFNVNVRVTGTCEVPVPDAFEPDNSNASATPIGKPNSIPDHATGWRGREKQEIQDHSIFPRNENDNMLIDLSQNETLMMVTQKGVSSMVEGTPDVPSGPAEDSQLFVLYQTDPHGGVCNRAPLSINNYCKDSSQCTSGGTPAVPSMPTTACIPLSQVVFPGEATPRFGTENPLLFNDDANPAAGNLGSKIELCFPSTQGGSPTLASKNNPFVMRTRGWRPPFSGSVSTLSYDYQAKAQVRGRCEKYEAEPNNSFADATPLPDEALFIVSGVWEGSETYPAADVDVWGPFDVEGPEEYTIEVFPQIINSFGDSELSLWAGPSDSGDFVQVAMDNDSGKPNSRINRILEPADDVVGNSTGSAGYYIVVTTDPTQPVPNWWYNMRVLTPRVDAVDIEDNHFYPQVVEYRGNTIITGAVDAVCDIDRYQYTLNEAQFMTFATTGFTDTVLNLEAVVDTTQLNIHTYGIAGEHASNPGPHAFGIAGTMDNFKGVVRVAMDSGGASLTDCCDPPFSNDISGVIGMCDRGNCGFAVKARNVQDAGATGFLLANNSTSAPPGMGGTDPAVVIPCVSTTQAAGTAMKSTASTIKISLTDRTLLACDDDSNPIPGNPYASKITGCLPPGDYVLSVRGWNGSTGAYVFQMAGVAGCTPTDPPTLDAAPGSFCLPSGFERLGNGTCPNYP